MPIQGLLAIVVSVIIFVILILVVCIGYVKAKPDEAIIITGLGKARVLSGRAGVMIPFIERRDKLDLAVTSIDVKTSTPVPTKDFINVKADSVVKVQIPNEPEFIERASKNFLNKNEQFIAQQVGDLLEGNVREVIGQLELKELAQDKQLFSEKVQQSASKDVEALGLKIISFNIQNVQDDKGAIDNLGADNLARITKEASIARANAEMEVKIAQAEANKKANDAQVMANTEISIKQNELAVKQATLKAESDLAKANADVAYDLQIQERRKEVESKTAEANLVKEQKAIEVQKAIQEASEKVTADTELYKQQKEADAELYKRTKDAEAKLIEQQKEAEAIKAKGEAEAEAIKVKGQAEANAIQAKLLAEAQGLDKKAEALAKMDKAGIAQMYFDVLPKVAESIAKPLNNVDKITMYGDGNSTKLVSDITNSLTKIISGTTEATGLDIQNILGNFMEQKTIKNED